MGANVSWPQLARAATLAGARLPDGTYVARLGHTYQAEHFMSKPKLPFAICSEGSEFHKVDWSEAELFGARLASKFGSLTLIGAQLRSARLNGIFLTGDWRDAIFVDAHLGGIFSMINAAGADFAGASFAGGHFRSVHFDRARNLSEEQLRAAHALRYCWMPDGRRYDGRLNLPGDQKELLTAASTKGSDPEDESFIGRGCLFELPSSQGLSCT